ncbi:hypothetical protein AB0D54_26265 [Streptomyces xanthophaeus]|uniref:hypothetical protein n=1 Tax=Streptomyces xanthophaeus TaxID=67385 RepID=UPI0034234FD5
MITFTTGRKTVLTAGAIAVALATLSGCEDAPGGTAAPAPSATSASPAPETAPAVPTTAGAFSPEQAVAEAERTPYAATITFDSSAAGQHISTMTGRGNHNAPFTGRSEIRTPDDVPASQAIWMETVTTADANYVRNRLQEGSGWTKMPRAKDNEANYAGYAKLLLTLGPSALKGMEEQGGIPTYHLAGRLDANQVASVDPRTHRSMKAKGVTGFDIDQWVDSQGRTVRFEQRMEMRGIPAVNTGRFSDFGPVEEFNAPSGG